MKKYLLLAISTLVFATSCEKEPAKQDDTNTTTPTYYMKFKIDGTEYSGNSVNGHKGLENKDIQTAAVFTYNGKLASIGVYVRDYTVPKTYVDSLGGGIMVGDETGMSYISHNNKLTTVKIISYDENGVKGEFNGTLYHGTDTAKTINVTEGSFYVKLLN
jgi:hypothetical protein